MSKAAQNDPPNALSLHELYWESPSPLSKQEPSTGENFQAASPGAFQHNSDHSAGVSVHEAKTNFDGGDVVRHHRDNLH